LAVRYHTPAIVVGLNPTGLGLVRSLHPWCTRIVGVESDRDQPGVRSRLCNIHVVPNLSDHDALFAELIRLSKTFDEKPVLFFSSDEHVTSACRRADELSRYFRITLPDPETCDTLMFKDQFIRFAQRENHPIPVSGFLPVADLKRHVRDAGFKLPVIVKPTNKSGAWERKQLSKAYIVREAAELDAVEAAAEGVVESVLVQEYIEGDDANVFFCLYFAAPGLDQPVAFPGRKLLQWPPSRGSTAVCEPVDAPELEAFTRSFFGRLGIQGFCSLEVKYDRDGRFQIIEPTVGRPDLQSYVATLNGVNIPLAAYLALVGRPREANACVRRRGANVLWIHEGSLLNLVRQRAVRGATLWSLFRRRRGYLLASLSDPGVFLSFLQDQARRALRKIVFRPRAVHA
jgi:D-aspartate ligase